MNIEATNLQTRNRAQAGLKFSCSRLQKIIGGARKLEDVNVEEWEACLKNVEKIASILEKKEIDPDVVNGYGVEPLVIEIRDKITGFVSALGSVVGGVSEQDAARFQIKEKLGIAIEVLAGLQRTDKAAKELSKGLEMDRKQWELDHPIPAEQERELQIYSKTLRDLLLRPDGLNRLAPGEWIQAEGCLKSLEQFLLEHKIEAKRIVATGFEILLRAILSKFAALDKEGIDRDAVNVDRAERVWGLVDKLGSGLSWLSKSDRTLTSEELKPTTRSTFLLKSAPPAKMRFSSSKQEWQEKELLQYQSRIKNIVLDEGNPITIDDEQRWSSAYRELEHLQALVKEEKVQAASIKTTKLDTTIMDVERRITELHGKRGKEADAGVGEFALMYVTWECAMRLSKQFEELGVK